MEKDPSKTARIIGYTMAVVAVGFGLMTLKAGGSVLFGSDQARRAAGDYVPFVVWFNFTAGFAYVAAGVGLWNRRRWARWLAALIAAGSALTYLAFGLHVFRGGAYEMRTVVAMGVRTGLWTVIAVVSFGLFGRAD